MRMSVSDLGMYLDLRLRVEDQSRSFGTGDWTFSRLSQMFRRSWEGPTSVGTREGFCYRLDPSEDVRNPKKPPTLAGLGAVSLRALLASVERFEG